MLLDEYDKGYVLTYLWVQLIDGSTFSKGIPPTWTALVYNVSDVADIVRKANGCKAIQTWLSEKRIRNKSTDQL